MCWKTYQAYVGWDGIDSIVPCYQLDGPGIESPWGAKASAPSRQALGPTQATIQSVPGLSQVVKWVEGSAERPNTSSAEVKETVELYFYSLSGPSQPDLGKNLPIPFYHIRLMLKLIYRGI